MQWWKQIRELRVKRFIEATRKYRRVTDVYDIVLQLVSVTLVVGSFRHLVRGRMHARRYRRHARPMRLDAVRCGAAAAPLNGAIHVVPKRPSLHVYDPFYGPPAVSRTVAYLAPLFTDREGKQPPSITCYYSYANRLHSWSTVVHV